MKKIDKTERFVIKIIKEIKNKVDNILFKNTVIEYNISISHLSKTIITIYPYQEKNCEEGLEFSDESKIYSGYSSVGAIGIEYNLKGELKSIQIDFNFFKKDGLTDFIPKIIKINSVIDKISKIIKKAYDKNIIEFKKNNPNINLLI